MSAVMARFSLLVLCCAAALAAVRANPVLPGSLGTLRNELAGIVSTGADETQDTAAGEVVATDTTAESGLASGQCSIIFDFDGVIKIYQDQFDNDKSIGVDAAEVLKTVGERDLKMGIATMSCERDFIKRYLSGNFGEVHFPNNFLSSESAQFCEPKKSVQMAKIINHTGGDMGCAILYDDSIGNKPDVINAGHVYQFVDRYVGITKALFEEGLGQLRARGNCNC